MIHLIEARYEGEFRIWCRFSDGKEGVVDLRDELYGEVFAPLKNPEIFRRFRVGPISQTLEWDNGADLAPEFLYESVQSPIQTGSR